MVHFNSEVYHLGEGYDAVELCLQELQKVSENKAKKNFGGTAVDNAFYGGVGCNGHTKLKDFRTYEYACHKYMSYFEKPECMYNRFTHRPTLSDKARRAYFEWIMSDDSPWKEFKNRHETHLPDDYTGDKREWIYRHGWVWSDFSAPSNLQHSFLVASRMVAEWPKLISKWYKWQQKGLNPALSFLFLDVFHSQTGLRDSDNRQIFKINGSSLYDWPFNICTSPESTVRNFLIGKLDTSVLNKPYSEMSKYTPVNSIFGENNSIYDSNRKSGVVSYTDTLYDLYHEKFGMSKEDSEKFWHGQIGFSRYDHRKYWTVREVEILEIIKLEEERLSDSTTSTKRDALASA